MMNFELPKNIESFDKAYTDALFSSIEIDCLKELKIEGGELSQMSPEQKQVLAEDIMNTVEDLLPNGATCGVEAIKAIYGEEMMKELMPYMSEMRSSTMVDDNGKPYMKNGELLPNTSYELKGTKYETDSEGRIIRAEATVEINNAPRPSLNSRKVEGLEHGDDKGHIIAHVLGGSDTEGNLVAQDSKLNRGEYKSMELSAKRAREEGKEVEMTIDIKYEGDSKRPKSFTVILEINGEITVKKFLNKTNE